MCDGQICLSSAIFAEGVRPAIDITTSLSIIGGRVQSPLMRTLTLGLRADYAQYNEVLALSRLQSGLSDEAQATVDRGQSIASIFVQMQYQPVAMADQVLLLFGLYKGVLNKMTDPQRHKFSKEFPVFVRERFAALYESLDDATELTPALEKQLSDALDAHMDQLSSGAKKKEPANETGSA